MLVAAIALLTMFLSASVAGVTDKPPIDEAAEAELLALAGEGAQLKRTPHFVVAYNTDTATLNEFISRIEATYRGVHRFLKHHDIKLEVPDRRLEILFFSSPADFHAYAKRIGVNVTGAAGFYHAATNRAAFFNAASMSRLDDVNRQIEELETQLKDSRGRRSSQRDAQLKQLRILRNRRDNVIESVNQLVVQHEVAHQVFFNAGLHARDADQPPWIVEGLACLFETPPGADGAGMGAVNQYRLLTLREAIAGRDNAKNATADDYFDASRTGRLKSLRDILSDKTLFNTARPDVEQNYALAWSVVHFLQRREREKLGDYLTVLAKRPRNRGYTGEQELYLFEAAFGKVDEAFERRWIEYILSLRVH